MRWAAAHLHLEKIGVKLTKKPADHLGVPVQGPYQPEHCRCVRKKLKSEGERLNPSRRIQSADGRKRIWELFRTRCLSQLGRSV